MRARYALVVATVALASSLVPLAARADDSDYGNYPDGAEPLPTPTGTQPKTLGSLLVWTGASYRALFGLPVESLSLGAGAGAELDEHVALYVRGNYDRGQMAAGLPTQLLQIGASVEGIFGRFRPGVGVDLLSWFALRRITDGSWLNGRGFGAYVLASYDLVRFERHAVYLGARFDADFSGNFNEPGAVLGAQGTVGYRW